ncbi:hypothetical protein [Acutalibacter caecimuris]|uniref:hypothetical protein n=1 Tax=Acutalibacter caecimuris TaxID=3093657 RepID=UPI002AC9896F|nr:hypothetical protein [Acutalibacter sp. M00118]
MKNISDVLDLIELLLRELNKIRSAVDEEETYRRNLRFCANHGLICLEYHRRHAGQEEKAQYK